MKSIFGKIALVGFLVVAVAVVFHWKGNKPDPAGETLQLVTSSSAFAESTSQPEEAKNVSIPRILELGADKCVPCKMMQPILDELRKDYPGKLQVDFIDVWKEPAQAEKYAISGIPTQ
ncbi:MAG: thioredoxin family protein, partial [Atribacterota bacterium]